MTVRDRDDRPFLAVAAAGLGTATAVATIGPLGDPDAWWNLRAGQYLLQTGRFAGPDPWSHFSRHQFVLTEWLGSVVAALLYGPFGPAALVWMRTLGGVAIVALLYLLARRCAGPAYAVLATLVGLLGFSGSISERPQTLGLALLLLTLLLWRSAALSGSRPTLWLLPLGWVFAASHGYWVLGVAVGLATAVGLALDRRSLRAAAAPALIALGTGAVAALTPVGPSLVLSPLTVRSAAAGLVGEWQRASPTQPLVVLAVALVAVVAVLWTRTGTSWWRVLHLLLALGLAVSYSRLSAPAMAITVPLAAEALQRLVGRRTGALPVRPPTRFEGRLMAAAGVAVLAVGTALAPASAGVQRHTPVSLEPAISRIPAGATVFDDYNVSSWMLFTYPRLGLVIDTRLEVFDARYVGAYVRALGARPGWQDFVASSGASWAVLREAQPLTRALEGRGWLVTATGDGYVVLQRDPA